MKKRLLNSRKEKKENKQKEKSMTWKTDQQWEKNESKMIFKEINIIYNALLKGIRKRERED